MRRWVPILLGTMLAAAPGVAHAALPPIHHVYIIVLENQGEATTFGPNPPAPYLGRILRRRGAFVPHYFGIGHESNDNYLAMISGQAPNVETQADCMLFADFLAPGTAAYGQQVGLGCAYPSSIPTIAGQLDAAGLSWRDYNEGMGANPMRETTVCAHPPRNTRDNTQSASAADQYATRHNPFVYFHSIIDNTAYCDSHVVNLDQLPRDLSNPDAPEYVFITPNLCSDGHDAKCADPKQRGGYSGIDHFLRTWVPRITSSPAFTQDGGLLIITFDEAATSDSHACCGEIAGPGSPRPGIGGPGGGDVGAVLLSPYIRPGTVTPQAYNHYTMLRSVEDLFGLPHIGYAQLPGGRSFGSDIFACAPAHPPVPVHGRLPAGSEIERARLVHNRLTLYSVGNSKLRVRVTRARRRPVTITRTLVPCTAYSIALPAGHVTVSAFARGGTQTIKLG